VARRFAPLLLSNQPGSFISASRRFTGLCGLCRPRLADFFVARPLPGSPLLIRKSMRMSKTAAKPKQLLHLVFGGELESLEGVTFRDLHGLDIVGIYPNYAEAHAAWKAAAQRSVDNALMRYFVVHLHRLLDPAIPEE
jgi:Domain of unknown function (DUF4170)